MKKGAHYCAPRSTIPRKAESVEGMVERLLCIGFGEKGYKKSNPSGPRYNILNPVCHLPSDLELPESVRLRKPGRECAWRAVLRSRPAAAQGIG